MLACIPGPDGTADRVRWIGDDGRGIELEITAVDLPDYLLVVHVMPTTLWRYR